MGQRRIPVRDGYDQSGNDQTSTADTHPTIMIADIDGSGLSQVIYFPAPLSPGGPPLSNATAVRVAPDNTIGQIGGGPIDGLLQSVSNGAGAVTTFSYQSIDELNRELGIGPVPVPVWVVTQRQTTNSLITGGPVTTTTKLHVQQCRVRQSRASICRFSKRAGADAGGCRRRVNGRAVKTTFATNACIPTTGPAVVENNGCNDPESTGYYSIYHATRVVVAVERMRSSPTAQSALLSPRSSTPMRFRPRTQVWTAEKGIVFRVPPKERTSGARPCRLVQR